MSATTAAASTTTNFNGLLNGTNAGVAQNSKNQSIQNFAASLSTAAVVFGIQLTAFLLLSGNWKLRHRQKTHKPDDFQQSLFQKI